jgi:hypothetical protein
MLIYLFRFGAIFLAVTLLAAAAILTAFIK